MIDLTRDRFQCMTYMFAFSNWWKIGMAFLIVLPACQKSISSVLRRTRNNMNSCQKTKQATFVIANWPATSYLYMMICIMLG